MEKQAQPEDERAGAKKWPVKLLVSVALLVIPPVLVFFLSKLLISGLSGKTLLEILTRLLGEPFFYAFLATILGIYLVGYWLQHIGYLKTSLANKVKSNLERIVVSILLVSVPFGLVFLFSQLSMKIDPNGMENAAFTLRNALEQLPTQTTFYVVIMAFVSACFVWRWWQYISLGKEFLESEKLDGGSQGLTPRDWWVALGLEFCILPSTRSRLSQDSLNL